MPWTMAHIDSQTARWRPVCEYCKKDFGRRRERERHVRDKRMPRCRHPCGVAPVKIRAHLMVDHAKIFATEMLEGMTLCSRHVIECLSAFNYVPDVEATLPSLN